MPSSTPLPRPLAAALAVLLAGVLLVALAPAAPAAAAPAAPATDRAAGRAAAVGGALARPSTLEETTPARLRPYQLVEDRPVDDRLAQPEDRYAMAGGCYTIEVAGQGYVTRDLTLTAEPTGAEPFHFQPLRLGEYLLATNEGPDTSVEGAWWDERGYLAARPLLPQLSLRGTGLPTPGEGLLPNAPLPQMPATDAVRVADEPSPLAEWRIVAAGDDPERKIPGDGVGQGRGQGNRQTYVATLPRAGKALVADGARLALADGEDGAELTFRHVADDRPLAEGCARWPEIDVSTSGPPAPTGKGAADEVEGFFEAHVHGMAFEFLGGEARCGRPWHPYGVEYALGSCYEQAGFLNGVLEVVLAGRSPEEPFSSYDPVGWPTFDYWPRYDLLSHEQFYWRWLERAHHGGLRLLTNLLVDNTGLCQLYPFKRNSCNEMDGVRLQAQRLFELEDYIDAQSGGPGEGWLRIVTSPAQARETINAGRLAVVLGIEISVLFDCGEKLDLPECTEEEIDERLDEVFDMGVRQMQLINKFDNALSGVTGDGGPTGVLVNHGNRITTGHYWDMVTCEDDDGHDHDHAFPGAEHDKTQINLRDEVPGADAEEIDVLAGAIFSAFGATRGLVAPVYPEGPHCNTRGLTDLGRYVITGMIERGMIFDPDHMSAAAQREALDHIHTLVEAEQAAADAEDRPAVQPAVISSHSWANDVTYQRIYDLDGVVAPRTARPDGFARAWRQHRAWFDLHAPAESPFGLGYGADTNGFGAQPGPRQERDAPFDYEGGWAAPIGEVTLYQQTSGVRTFDIEDGVAHYGLLADWFRDVELAAEQQNPGDGARIRRDMLAGAETYLRLWERAAYGGNDCVEDQSRFQLEDLHALLGANLEGFLTAIGQPLDRDGAVYVYCVDNGSGDREVVEVTFDDDGIAAAVRPGSVLSWLTAARAGAPLDHHHAPDGVPAAPDGHGHDGPVALVLLAGMAVVALRLQPSRRFAGSQLAVALPLLAVLAFARL
jgi:hypothetical protein